MKSRFTSYKELQIWQKGIDIVKDVYALCRKLPESEKFGLISQMKRCSISIPSNIAEGWGRGSNKAFGAFIKISRGSLTELETQIYIAKELNFIQKPEYDKLSGLITEESKMINSFLNKIKD